MALFGYNDMMIVTDIAANKRNKARVSVFLDGSFGFSCFRTTLEDERICKGMSLQSEDVERIRARDSEQYAWECAVRYLSRGLKTEMQVRKKLEEHEADPDVIEQVIDRLTEYGLLDDREYAKLYAEQLYRNYGRWAVARKLREKGIAASIAEEAASKDGDTEVLQKHAERLWNRYSSEDRERRVQKMTRSLSARGFEFDEIRRAIQELEQGGPAEDDAPE